MTTFWLTLKTYTITQFIYDKDLECNKSKRTNKKGEERGKIDLTIVARAGHSCLGIWSQ